MVSKNNLFNSIFKSPNSELRKRAQSALDWFRGKVTNEKTKPEIQHTTTLTNPRALGNLPNTKEELLADQDRIKKREHPIGRMYFFVYDPKHKDTLPYYDKFPLVFPFRILKDGFIGINLHYLDIRSRSILLDQLMQLANNKKYNETTRLKLSYQALQAIGNYHEPCIKRYLTSHVRSQFIRVNANEWEHALYLPVHEFEKATASRVWRESRKKIM